MKLLACLVLLSVLVYSSQAVPTKQESFKVESLLPPETQGLSTPVAPVTERETSLQSPKQEVAKLGPKNNRKRKCFWGWWGYDDYYPGYYGPYPPGPMGYGWKRDAEGKKLST